MNKYGQPQKTTTTASATKRRYERLLPLLLWGYFQTTKHMRVIREAGIVPSHHSNTQALYGVRVRRQAFGCLWWCG